MWPRTWPSLLDGNVFVAHDIRFDLPFLRWEFARRGLARPAVTGPVHAAARPASSGPTWPAAACPTWRAHFGIATTIPTAPPTTPRPPPASCSQALTAARELGLVDLGDLLPVEEIRGRPRGRGRRPGRPRRRILNPPFWHPILRLDLQIPSPVDSSAPMYIVCRPISTPGDYGVPQQMQRRG